jgi:hypothetical protein
MKAYNKWMRLAGKNRGTSIQYQDGTRDGWREALKWVSELDVHGDDTPYSDIMDAIRKELGE